MNNLQSENFFFLTFMVLEVLVHGYLVFGACEKAVYAGVGKVEYTSCSSPGGWKAKRGESDQGLYCLFQGEASKRPCFLQLCVTF